MTAIPQGSTETLCYIYLGWLFSLGRELKEGKRGSPIFLFCFNIKMNIGEMVLSNGYKASTAY